MVSMLCAFFVVVVCMAFVISAIEYCSDDEHED